MTVEQLIAITGNTERFLILDGGKQIFVGAGYLLTEYQKEDYEKIKKREVRRFKFHLVIRHKRWKELGLMEPLEPEAVATYQYQDLQEELYYKIQI